MDPMVLEACCFLAPALGEMRLAMQMSRSDNEEFLNSDVPEWLEV